MDIQNDEGRTFGDNCVLSLFREIVEDTVVPKEISDHVLDYISSNIEI